MSIPATTYDIATITNPSSALTDFTYMIDLSRMSAAWWAEVNTSDGTRGRASEGTGTTEHATDWLDFDDSGHTGFLRGKWTGSLASSGTQEVRVFPPNTANASYGVSDTYGQNNAYDSATWGYYPLSDRVDRTANGYDLFGNGSIVWGGETGHIGDSTLFTQSAGQFGDTDTVNFPFTGDFTLSVMVKHATQTSDQGVIGSSGNQPQIWRDEFTNDRYAGFLGSGVGYGTTNPGTSWAHVSLAKATTGILYVNGVSEASSIAASGLTDIQLRVGTAGGIKFMDGYMQHMYISTSERSDSWHIEEESQLSDNSTFWGTWTNVPVGATFVDFTGAMNGSGTLASIMQLLHNLSGSVDGVGTIDSILQDIKNFSGTVDGAGTITALLQQLKDLSGTVDGTGLTEGSFDRLKDFTGAVNGVGTSSGSFVTIKDLSGSIIGTGQVTGLLEASGRVYIDLSGSFDGLGTLDANLKKTVLLSGAINGSGDIIGLLEGATVYSEILLGTSTITLVLSNDSEITTQLANISGITVDKIDSSSIE